MTKKYLLILFVFIANTCVAGITEKYSQVVTTDKGFIFKVEPITYDEKYKKDKGLVVKEPSNAKFMRDGNPWPDDIIDYMHHVYATSWETFDDLKKAGIKTTNPLTLAFVLYDDKGNIVGDAGIQTVRRGLEAEIFFNIMPEYRRKGIGYAVSKYLIDFYRNNFKGDKIAATAMPHNKASKGLLIKLGMTRKCDKKGNPMVYRNEKYGKNFDIFIMSVR